MDEFVKMAELTSNYVAAMRRGLDKFAGMLPILTEQHMSKLADDKLNSTRDTFMDAVKVSMNDWVLIVELDKDNWLANAVENGADPFNMKETHLKGPKVRWSKPNKEGISYKYLRVPIGKDPEAKPGGTDKSKKFQQKINEVMMKPQFGMKRLKSMMDGTVVESQQVMNSDPDLTGLYRVRQFESPEAYHAKKSKPKWNLVLFRTISEKPFTRSEWQHPGIRPAGIFKETQTWLQVNADAMLSTFLENEIDKIEGL
jgi:hypothetical protein